MWINPGGRGSTAGLVDSLFFFLLKRRLLVAGSLVLSSLHYDIFSTPSLAQKQAELMIKNFAGCLIPCEDNKVE